MRLEFVAFDRRFRITYEKAYPSLAIPKSDSDWLLQEGDVLTAAEMAVMKKQEKAKRANT